MDNSLLFVAAFLGGAINSVAGGGLFFTFPFLVMTGVPGVAANLTSAFTLFPGSLSNAFAYRRKLTGRTTLSVPLLLFIGGLGSFIGALLLMRTPNETFAVLSPFLVLFATLTFAFGDRWTERFKNRFQPSPGFVLGALFLLSMYGGYFGGAAGVLILGLLSFFAPADSSSEMIAIRNLILAFVNGVAVLAFLFFHAIYSTQACFMVTAAVMGGYFGATISKRIPAQRLKQAVVVIGAIMTVYFFVRIGPGNPPTP
jgi:uncharacterized membrane protein YfcA